MPARVWAETSLDGNRTRYTEIAPNPQRLRMLLEKWFPLHWRDIVSGPFLEGAVVEIRCESAPELRFSDGYLTLDFGRWHFHLFPGPHNSSPGEELRRKRPVRKAAFLETRGTGCAGGRCWGVRFWNGFDEQMLTIFLPNPYLSEDLRPAPQPDWSRLSLYYELRRRWSGEPVPEDPERVAEAPWPEFDEGGMT